MVPDGLSDVCTQCCSDNTGKVIWDYNKSFVLVDHEAFPLLSSIFHFTVPHSQILFWPPMPLMLTLYGANMPTKYDFLFDMLYKQQLSMVIISCVFVGCGQYYTHIGGHAA